MTLVNMFWMVFFFWLLIWKKCFNVTLRSCVYIYIYIIFMNFLCFKIFAIEFVLTIEKTKIKTLTSIPNLNLIWEMSKRRYTMWQKTKQKKTKNKKTHISWVLCQCLMITHLNRSAKVSVMGLIFQAHNRENKGSSRKPS
jgi:hypothetical protein